MRRTLSIMVLLGGTSVYPQNGFTTPDSQRTKTVIPGPDYAAGSVHRFFMGDGYRDVWSTEVRLPVLDLSTFAGGIKPIRRGGGMQTNSLRFLGADSITYVFRSVDKFPGRGLPEELRGTVIEALGKDQISLMLPFGSLVVSSLAEKAGVLHPKPLYVVLPDDPALGEYRNDFAGLLGSFEERPDESRSGHPGFAHSEKVLGSLKLSEKLDDSTEERVDSDAYLTARLLDLLVGDWDRHADQWRWARFKRGEMNYWKPVPRDRDFAFVVYDGVIPWIMDRSWAFKHLDSYHKKKPDISSLVHNARHLDGRLLNGMDWTAWQQTITRFMHHMDDMTIEIAVQQLPPEVYRIAGAALEQQIKYRRDILPDLARQYYLYQSAAVNIQTTKKDDHVILDFMEKGKIHLCIAWKKMPDNPYIDRVFLPSETKELRLYLLGGDDQVMVKGSYKSPIICRIIGGKGDDTVIKPSETNKIYVYDTKQGLDVTAAKNIRMKVSGKETAHERPPVGYPESRFTRSAAGEKLPPPFDFGRTWQPLQYFGFDCDHGLFIGGGIEITNWAFRADPYSSRHRILGNFALRTDAFRLRYDIDYYTLIPHAQVNFSMETVVPEDKPNFFGFGNTTEWEEEKERDNFYRARNEYVSIASRVEKSIGDFRGWIGAEYLYLDSDIKESEGRLIDQLKDNLYGIDVKQTFSVQAGISVDKRDHPDAPTRGCYYTVRLKHVPHILDSRSDYTTVDMTGRAYWSPVRRFTIASRARYVNVSSTFPYYHAAYLGGPETLRGYNLQRFAGDQAVSGSMEWRYLIRRVTFVIPSDLGIYIYGDGGRVWWNGQSPGEWHPGYGAGIYLVPVLKSFTMSASLARSNEAVFGYAHLGFAF